MTQLEEEDLTRESRDWTRGLEWLLEENRITPTCCGVILACNSEEEAKGILSLDLAQHLGPVNVTRLPHATHCDQKLVILSNVPLTIPLADIEGALRNQRIEFNHLDRSGTDIYIELKQSNDYHYLIKEGLNFYDSTNFNALPEYLVHSDNRHPYEGQLKNPSDSIIQCYRCQGFWHVAAKCPLAPRCVRCGGGHSVYACLRPRHEPSCCHCKGHHHAAYKECPVRLELANATPINIKLSDRNIVSKTHE